MNIKCLWLLAIVVVLGTSCKKEVSKSKNVDYLNSAKSAYEERPGYPPNCNVCHLPPPTGS